MLTQRMAKNANTLLADAVIDPEVRSSRQGLQQLPRHPAGLTRAAKPCASSARRPRDAREAGRAGAAFGEYRGGDSAILGNLQPLVNAKRARAFDGHRGAARGEENLRGYEGELGSTRLNFIAMAIAAVLAFVVPDRAHRQEFLDDPPRAPRRERAAEHAEPGGDPSPAERDGQPRRRRPDRARPGDRGLTGAIADSVNYTIEELRGWSRASVDGRPGDERGAGTSP